MSGKSPYEDPIFQSALRYFRQTCDGHYPHPECPYREELSPGKYDCNFQCEELIAIVSDEGKTGVTFERRRRVGSTKVLKIDIPFDAGQREIDERDLEVVRCSSVTLLTRLRNDVKPTMLSIDKIAVSDDIVSELESRGFPVDRLIRLMAVEYRLMWLATRILSSSPEESPAVSAWKRLLESQEWFTAQPGESREPRFFLIPRVGGIIQTWYLSAPFQDVISGFPAHWDDVWDVAPIPPLRNYTEEFWILDRLTKTYLSDWSISSLLSERAYLNSSGALVLSPPGLEERRVTIDAVEHEIAERAVKDQARRQERDGDHIVDGSVEQLLNYIASGTLQLAIKLAEAVAVAYPLSSFALNNLGFCLMPIDPEAALDSFQRANALSPVVPHLPVNMVQVFHLLERNRDALVLAETTYLKLSKSTRQLEAYMWPVDLAVTGRDPRANLVEVCLRCFLAELAMKMAKQLDDRLLSTVWSERYDYEVCRH
ncbi:hypothetical protein [Ferrimicrobium sp.]|jgi:hypothetical protein|uniref:tetratricopeptide repeat protein n=1 Tax=Ferrimicrobium sp. TaxID=2926050 RepID=UPI00260824E3|nr:hypothetical protein [Ferrimicrobium sp.]